MSKGLEALKYITEIGISQGCQEEAHQVAFKSEIIEKELKALKIIKKKNVDIWDVKYSEDYEHYNLMTSAGTSKNHIHKPITQEEHDLLKEVLL